MPLWSLDNPPAFAPTAIATNRGWEIVHANGITEIIVAIENLADRQIPAGYSYLIYNGDNVVDDDGLKVIVRV